MSWRTRKHGSPRQVGKPYKVRGGRVKGVARSTRYKSTPADKQFEREMYAAEIKAERDLEAHAVELDKRRQRYAAKRKYVKNKMVYRVYGEPSQLTTTIDVTHVPSTDVFNKVEETLTKRFGNRIIRINHAGKTVKLKEWDDYS